MDEIEVRWAKKEEWSTAMTMVWKTFLSFEASEYGKTGTREFFEFITDDRLHESFDKGLYQMAVAVKDGRIVGVGSLRNVSRLSLLFADTDFIRMGIGSKVLEFLCAYLKDEAGEKMITVKAAPSAVGFYKKAGFSMTGALEHYSGISVYPMEKSI